MNSRTTLVPIPGTPVITMRRSNNFTCLLLSVMFVPACLSRDTITVGTITYPGGTTLVSAGERFELGFFSPNGRSDSRRYIGIWFYRSDPKIIVWVANRDEPLVGPNASFGLVDGNLKLWNEKRPIPLTNFLSSSNRLVKLLDSGNLVLIEDGREEFLWQSFDHPTDTFLPGMRMTENFMLTSWAKQDDPRRGNFTFQMDQQGGNNYDLIQNLIPYWKSGVYGKFIQADQMLDVISFLLSNFTTSTTATSLPAGTSPAWPYENITRPSFEYYNNSRLVMNYNGRIQYFRRGNGSKPVWFEPASQCSVLSVCGKFGSCSDENGNETMCRCLPGFEPAQQDKWSSGDFSKGCRRKSPICAKNSDHRAHDFLSLKKMTAGWPYVQISVDSEEQCRQKCLDFCSCQAYSIEEDLLQRAERGNLACYTWSGDLENIQESAPNGRNLYVRVPLSDIESTRRGCKTCGTNLVPYPLSTNWSCGDPVYTAFSCDNETAQLYFERPQRSYRVTSVNPEARTFTIQVNASDCTSIGQMEINLQLDQSSPFHVSRGCSGEQSGSSAGGSLGRVWSSEIKIVWRNPKEPICNSSEDCDWPYATCKKASDGIKRCLCNSGFNWNSFNIGCSPVAGYNVERGGSSVRLVYIVVPTSAAIFILVFGGLFYMGRQHGGSTESTQENPDFRLYDSEKRIKMWMDSRQFEEDKKGLDVPFFDLEIILKATNNFSDENKLGRGGFGPVYKATFPGGQEIAVKRLLRGSEQGFEEFKNEVILIAKLQHRNLVRLVGYCVKGDEKMLLYEYMPNKSLDSFIFDRTRCWLLNWEIRFEIILGIARGMLYLHQDSRLRIIHRDLKTSNILLDEEMTPKISDFGLARIFEAKQIEASTQRVIGTYGYMSPEYALDGFFSFKSDVFSFGVVILEIISGTRNTGFYRSQGKMSLLTHAWKLWNDNKALHLMDRVLHETYNRDQTLKCINVALLCVQEDPSDRPTMSDAVFMLGSETATLPAPKKPAFAVRTDVSTSTSSSKPESCAVLSTTLERGR
ncbi:G-type lectin S-receptor-like serine/threonine-protein kinase At4g03230 isoform X2 [Eucalyptus grandis]|uniref:G-type lectin S-receptor-like serine/threonine-protein kinase At4g03230 isoform X2 n=1 Tax=Eucalyptus grandis TaxID=71139 RepID=UPI00192E882B|nr:G-type lectin S-receptor-like serine/threonine-protein kinase At4g03230 isoform X2 [Eucalyptus grandis]